MPSAWQRRPRRRWGDWELYPGGSPTLGYKPPGGAKGFVYHVPIKECQTQEGYDDWLKQLKEKAGWDVASFRKAIEELRAEGKYLKN
jgi:hypothetical protein